MRSGVTCSWCHCWTYTDYRYWPMCCNCGHRADVPRMECNCMRCEGQHVKPGVWIHQERE